MLGALPSELCPCFASWLRGWSESWAPGLGLETHIMSWTWRQKTQVLTQRGYEQASRPQVEWAKEVPGELGSLAHPSLVSVITLAPGLHLGVRGAPSYEDTLGLLTHTSVFRKCPIYCNGLDPSLVTQETWGLALALPRTSYSELRHVLLCVAPALDLGCVNSLL